MGQHERRNRGRRAEGNRMEGLIPEPCGPWPEPSRPGEGATIGRMVRPKPQEKDSMKPFLVQVNDTKPGGWQTIQAGNKVDAAARAAVSAGVGRHTVYVALGPERHPTGVPLVVQSYVAQVHPKEEP